MNSIDQSQVRKILCGRRDAIADSWYRAITQVSCASLPAEEVRQQLVGLTEQAIAVLVTEPFEHRKAQAIGVALSQLPCTQSEVLGRSQELLAYQLIRDLPVDQIVALQPRLVALIGAVAVGFYQQIRETIPV